MYRSLDIDVQGRPMRTLIFEPHGNGPHPALVVAQHLPLAHEGLEKDPWVYIWADGIYSGQNFSHAGQRDHHPPTDGQSSSR